MIFIFTIPWSHEPLNSTTSQQSFTNRHVGEHSAVFNCLHSAILSARCIYLLRKVLPRFTQLFLGIQLGLLSRIIYRCNTRPAKSLISLWVRKFGIGVGQQQSDWDILIHYFALKLEFQSIAVSLMRLIYVFDITGLCIAHKILNIVVFVMLYFCSYKTAHSVLDK